MANSGRGRIGSKKERMLSMVTRVEGLEFSFFLIWNDHLKQVF